MNARKPILVAGSLCALAAAGQTLPIAEAAPVASRVFTNPVLPAGADPWVIRHGDDYFYCGSARGSIFVGKSASLREIGANRKKVFTPPPGTAYSRELWAPELHFLDNRWFVYFAADDGNNEKHRMWVLRSKTGDAQGQYELMGRLDTGDRWAIDGSVFEWNDKRYFIWSGWQGTENVAQNIYIAPMANPWTLGGKRVLISKPELPWELNGRPLINEGPTALRHGDRLFIVYSASGSWTDDYCLGRLDFLGGDPLRAKNWTKHPQAVFARTETVFGPGHASFVNDGKRDWIVYHAARRAGSGWERDVRMQPFEWNADGTPDFGAPLSPGVLLSE